MENEMIERVARAIIDAQIARRKVIRLARETDPAAGMCGCLGPVPYCPCAMREAADDARAAIEAMRPELEAIRKEMSDNAADLGGDGYFRRSEDVSRLVEKIDAALQPRAPITVS